jgi:cysteine desulfuration protein SufE
MSIKENLENIVQELSFFEDEMDKYEYIIELGKNMDSLDDKYKIDKNIVQGCSSQVWLVYQKDGDNLIFLSDGDAIITRGLVKIVQDIFTNHTPQEILDFDTNLLSSLNLSKIITTGRQNGVASMIEKIQEYAKKELS